jgi:hypothetical protein
MEGSNPYLTRILVNPSPVAYIKPGRGASRGTSELRHHNLEHNLIDIEYQRQAILEIQDRLDREIRHRLDTIFRLRRHHVNTIVIIY